VPEKDTRRVSRVELVIIFNAVEVCDEMDERRLRVDNEEPSGDSGVLRKPATVELVIIVDVEVCDEMDERRLPLLKESRASPLRPPQLPSLRVENGEQSGDSGQMVLREPATVELVTRVDVEVCDTSKTSASCARKMDERPRLRVDNGGLRVFGDLTGLRDVDDPRLTGLRDVDHRGLFERINVGSHARLCMPDLMKATDLPDVAFVCPFAFDLSSMRLATVVSGAVRVPVLNDEKLCGSCMSVSFQWHEERYRRNNGKASPHSKMPEAIPSAKAKSCAPENVSKAVIVDAIAVPL
jgi:hypothetical protein